MIRNASLPLAIVYTGWSHEDLFARNSSQTLLFYYWVSGAGLRLAPPLALFEPESSSQRTKASQLPLPCCLLRFESHLW